MACGDRPEHELRAGAIERIRAGGWSWCRRCGLPLGHVPADVLAAWRAVELMRATGGWSSG